MGECFIAVGAFVGSITSVRAHVCGAMNGLIECGRAQFAFIRLDIGVNAHEMSSGFVRCLESFVAHITCIWLLLGVSAGVSDDITTLSESLAAHITFEGFVPSVFAHVSGEC